ncbi:MAG: hypothetical protein JRZ94_04200 [Nitrososphaerota archaeon]|nr:hypothetical protein [Nitrososphaerota archaeon]
MKIRTKLVLVFVITAFCYSAGALISIEIISKQFIDTVGIYSIQITKSTLKNIYDRIDLRSGQLILIANNIEVLRIIDESNSDFEKMENRDQHIEKTDSDWMSGKSSEAISNVLSSELSLHLKMDQSNIKYESNKLVFSEIYVTNQYGVVIGSTGRTTDYLQSDEEWYQNAIIEKDGLWIGKPEYDESSRSYSIDIVYRINDDDGKFLGVIKGVYDLGTILVQSRGSFPCSKMTSHTTTYRI